MAFVDACSQYSDVIMSPMASELIGVLIVCSTLVQALYKTRQSSALLAFVRGIHRWSVNSPHKGPVTRKRLPFDDVIIENSSYIGSKQRIISLAPGRCGCVIRCVIFKLMPEGLVDGKSTLVLWIDICIFDYVFYHISTSLHPTIRVIPLMKTRKLRILWRTFSPYISTARNWLTEATISAPHFQVPGLNVLLLNYLPEDVTACWARQPITMS